MMLTHHRRQTSLKGAEQIAKKSYSTHNRPDGFLHYSSDSIISVTAGRFSSRTSVGQPVHPVTADPTSRRAAQK